MPTVRLAFLAAAIASFACRSPSDAESPDTSGASGDSGEPFGDPNAPGQDCPDSFDPGAVYVVLARSGMDRGLLFFADVEDPSRECAFNFPYLAPDDVTYGVRAPDGQLLGTDIEGYGSSATHSLYEANPDALEYIDGRWRTKPLAASNDEHIEYDFLATGCADAGYPLRLLTYPPTGEIGYVCDEGALRQTLRAFDGRVLATVPREPLIFLDDGRALVFGPMTSAFDPPIELEIVSTQQQDVPAVPVIPPDGQTLDAHIAQHVGAAIVVLGHLDDETSRRLAVMHLDGDRLVVDHTLVEPQSEPPPPSPGTPSTARGVSRSSTASPTTSGASCTSSPGSTRPASR